MTLEEQRDVVAQEMYEQYDFGVTVVDDEGWQKDGSSDFTKIVYVIFESDSSKEDEFQDSQRVSFHVVFKEKSAEVEDVYGLLMSNGSEIGNWNKPSESKKPKM